MPISSLIRALVFCSITAARCTALAQSAPISQSQAAALMQNPVVAEAVSAFRDDRARLCADVMPGGGRILRCLAAQAPAVSQQCKSALVRARDTLAAAGIAVQGLPDK